MPRAEGRFPGLLRVLLISCAELELLALKESQVAPC